MYTYLWYDFETYGADPKRDKISQFAGIRTDENFNILEEFEYYCKLSYDYIPNPEACLVTGITPNKANNIGITEEELSSKLFEIFTKPNTISVGYNSIKFDDEILRHLFYRTFRDPYKREWADGCSRWDFLKVVLGFYLQNSNSIVFPKDSEGKVSFKLENLSKANNIIHENAHDALSDVKATIHMAKLLKNINTDLYEYIFNLRQKTEVIKLLNRNKFFIHVDFSYGAENNYQTILYKLDYSFNRDEYVFFDLNSDLDLLYKENVEELKKLAYLKEELLELGKSRPGIKLIKANSIPLLFSTENLYSYSQAISKAKYIETRLREKLEKFCRFDKNISNLDFEIDPYNNFFSNEDKNEFELLRKNNYDFFFQKDIWNNLLVRFKARNFFEKIDEKDQKIWLLQCYKWLNGFEKRDGYLTFDLVKEKINKLSSNESDNRKKEILNDLKAYIDDLEIELNKLQIKTQDQALFHLDNLEAPKSKNFKNKKNKNSSGFEENLKLF